MEEKDMRTLIFAAFTTMLLSACSSEVGSEEWCADMENTPQSEWTPKEAEQYAENCIMGR